MKVEDGPIQISGAEKFFSKIFSSIKDLRHKYELAFYSYKNAAKALEQKESELTAAINNGKDLSDKLASSKCEYQALKSEYDQILESYKSTRLELDLTLKKSAEISENLAQSIKSYKSLEAEAQTYRDKAECKIKELNEKLEEISSSYDSLKQKAESERCDFLNKIEALQNQSDKFKERLIEVESRYSLVCSAISPNKIRSERYDRFNEVVTQHLLPLINRVTVLPNEAEQVMKIRAVDDELRLVESLKGFSERTIVAVAGGFSSGKSSFISSLFENEDLSLPIDIEPVTAIPTYVFHGEKLNINGYPSGGGCFEIPEKMYARLSHRFVEEFGFNLRNLIPFISLEVPMKSYKNLAFIDLPGYNPGDRDGVTSGDRSASEEYITQAQALIWMIGLDSNGTIPRDDLEHLWELAEINIPLYVVLNKADLRPLVSLDEVLDQVADELMMTGIPYSGLCAYSSENGGELSYRERSLWQVLEEWDQPRHAMSSVMAKIEDVLSAYEEALLQDIEKRKMRTGLVKALELNLLELGAFEPARFTNFDLDKYMNDESENEEAEEQESTSSFMGIFFKTLQIDSGNTNGNKSKKSKKDKLDSFSKSNDDDQRSNLVSTVRDQIQDLRDDYRTEQSEKDLNDLRYIRKMVKDIFTLG
ncbi:Dynamin family protein [Microbulbifer thermotolerans]|uniref:GTPase domain-containing protein n=1 Tax=Microbulbifer thermotolerans TaxID=252514 RepID=UPI0008EDE8CE|nr:dynamin family protein [Microbulbifer thermotolerans]MCX2836412.1 dynamin family protein [Microbulbifer thermotolerans]SFD16232.1 Dynamin family protein [Microbulbifer thermotolerans]